MPHDDNAIIVDASDVASKENPSLSFCGEDGSEIATIFFAVSEHDGTLLVYVDTPGVAENSKGPMIRVMLNDEAVFENPPGHCEECESEGIFFSGVPGILASVYNGKVLFGCAVERCDSCKRFESDEAAEKHMRSLGMIVE